MPVLHYIMRSHTLLPAYGTEAQWDAFCDPAVRTLTRTIMVAGREWRCKNGYRAMVRDGRMFLCKWQGTTRSQTGSMDEIRSLVGTDLDDTFPGLEKSSHIREVIHEFSDGVRLWVLEHEGFCNIYIENVASAEDVGLERFMLKAEGNLPNALEALVRVETPPPTELRTLCDAEPLVESVAAVRTYLEAQVADHGTPYHLDASEGMAIGFFIDRMYSYDVDMTDHIDAINNIIQTQCEVARCDSPDWSEEYASLFS